VSAPTGHGYRDKPRPAYPPTPSNGTKPQDHKDVAAAKRRVRAYLAAREASIGQVPEIEERDVSGLPPLLAADLQILLGPDPWTGDGGPRETEVAIRPGTGGGAMGDDWEIHESFGYAAVNNIQSTGTSLFDSDIVHQHYVALRIGRMERQRKHNRDYLHPTDEIIEVGMSVAQWGALVSSFGKGSGVPVTIMWTQEQGLVPGSPHEPRLAHSTAEVRSAARKAMDDVAAAMAALDGAWERKAGRREMADLLRNLRATVDNAPLNITFAANSLNEHVENVVTKARADIEAMVDDRARQLGIDPGVVLQGLVPVASMPELPAETSIPNSGGPTA
jgi:hypothetical protein